MAYLEDKKVKQKASLCLRILDYYKWLTNAYTLEFFTGNHWSLLPPCWQVFLPTTEPTEFSLWIRKGEQRKVWPLSLLAFRSLTKLASLDRTAVSDLSVLDEVIGSSDCEKIQFVSPAEEMTSQAGQHKDLLHVFRKHVKPKKQHEIFRLAKVCSLCSKTTSCSNLVDVGSGVGHLARFLHYGHDLNVVCLEAENDLSHSARKFDEDLMAAVSKKGENPKSPPRHAVCRLTPETDIGEFHEATAEVLEGGFGIVGLHTCGDLGPSTLRYFCASPRIRYLVSVGCCYMKIDLESNCEGPRGYPLSSYVSTIQDNCLNYESREVACHAQEMYLERLDAEECEKLKVHCYRAALECILVAKDPRLKRCGLRSVKNAHTLSFQRYAEEAVKRLEITLDSAEINTPEVAKCISRWKQVYLFYTLRLMLAPVIETVILLDRLLYLREKVTLVEANNTLPIVDCNRIRKKAATDLIELAQEIQKADDFTKANASNKLQVIAEQIRFLQEQARRILEDARQGNDLNHVACNFKKIPGKIYYLYKRESGQRYFSMLSPQEWGRSRPHEYLGAYRLEHDYSWTPEAKMTSRGDELQTINKILDANQSLAISMHSIMGNPSDSARVEEMME